MVSDPAIDFFRANSDLLDILGFRMKTLRGHWASASRVLSQFLKDKAPELCGLWKYIILIFLEDYTSAVFHQMRPQLHMKACLVGTNYIRTLAPYAQQS